MKAQTDNPGVDHSRDPSSFPRFPGDLPFSRDDPRGLIGSRLSFAVVPIVGGVAGVRGRESVDNKERAKGDEERGAVTHGEGQMEHGSGFGRGAFSRG
jgi:hypothetical protein